MGKSLGQKLKMLRISLGLSQAALAEAVGIHIKSIQRYETEKSQPDSTALRSLAYYFDVSADYLLGLMSLKEEQKEEENKIFGGGRYNTYYSRYVNCKNSTDVDGTAEYYWIALEEDGSISGQTEWVGWADEACTLERRSLRPVRGEEALLICALVEGRPMLLNEEADADVFLLFGGSAIVKKEVCERCLPEFLKDFIVEVPKLNLRYETDEGEEHVCSEHL